MIKNPQREAWVDLARFIGIFLVVLGHALIPEIRTFQRMFYLFHMPLFFFLAGYCFKAKYFNDVAVYVERRIARCYCPYVGYAVLFACLRPLFHYLHFYDSSIPRSPAMINSFGVARSLLIRILHMESSELLLSAFWFLPALLAASLVFVVLGRWLRQKEFCATLWLLILSIVALAWGIYRSEHKIPCVLRFNQGLVAVHMIVLGYLYKIFKSRICLRWWFSIICLAIQYCIVRCGFRLDMSASVYPPIYLLLIGELSGLYVCLWAAEKLSILRLPDALRRSCSSIGSHSLDIMILHFLAFKVVSWIYVCANGLPSAEIARFPVSVRGGVWAWLYVIAGLSLPLLWTALARKAFSGVHEIFARIKERSSENDGIGIRD